MAKKTKEEALETRNMLLDTAELVFNKKGVSATTLADIAAAAGMTRGAIYWHFKNKADLFEAMCDRVQMPLEAMTAANGEEGVEDPLGELLNTLRYLFAKLTSDEHYHRVFDILFNKCEFVEQVGPIVDRDGRVRNQFRERFKRIFTNAVRLGQLPADTDLNLAVNGYLAFTTGIMRNWLLEPSAFELERDGIRMISGYVAVLKLGSQLPD